MSYAYGMRFDDNSNAITVIDEDNQTAVTTGYIDGEYVEFGGGGGGSSDFSTAEVTVVNNSANEVELQIMYLESIPWWGDVLSSLAYIGAQDTQTIVAVLYNNKSLVYVYGLNASVSGNASIENDDAVITGDCTITIS